MNSHAERCNIFLNILGVQLMINCLYEECANGITHHFSQFIEQPWRSPDIIIECNLKSAERKLFRAIDIDTALDDINIYLPRIGKIERWEYLSPLLPPYYLEPFRNRFVGLHASAVDVSGKGAIIIAGNRTHGKTTSAIHLVNSSSGCSLLADETVHIHKRSISVEPFPTSLYVCKSEGNNNITKRSVKAENACKLIAKRPISIYHLIFLNKDIKYTESFKEEILPEESIDLLLKHHVDLGCDKNEAMHTLFSLAKHIPATKFSFSKHEDLLAFSLSLSEI